MNLSAEFAAALDRIQAGIDARADKQRKWLKAAGIVFNRSNGQRHRWAVKRSNSK